MYYVGVVQCVQECRLFFFFQAEDGIRDLVRSRGLGDVYKRQTSSSVLGAPVAVFFFTGSPSSVNRISPICFGLPLSLIHI